MGKTKRLQLELRMLALVALMVTASLNVFAAISNFTAGSDATNSSYSYTYSGTPSYLQVFLDTDRSASTGYRFQTIGADFLIENQNLYKYSGSAGAWGWTYVGPVSMTKSGTTSIPKVSWTLARTAIGSPSAVNVMGRTSSGDVSQLVTQTLSTSLGVSSPTATSDQTYAYYKVSYTGSPVYIQILLDSDSNSGTGYVQNSVGSEYLLEIGTGYAQLFKYLGTNNAWQWTLVKSVTTSNVNGVANFTVARADIGFPSAAKLFARVVSSDSTSAISSVVLQSFASLPTPTPAPTSTPTPSPTPAPTGSRDPLKQPFASNSIWNMPIGSGAQFVPVNFPAVPSGDVWAPMPQIDDELIILRPTSPLMNIMYSNAGWSGSSRCNYTGTASVLAQAPIPADFIFDNKYANAGSAILLADKRTVLSTQPFNHCSGFSYATSLVKFATADLYGDGRSGAHGGSYLSTIGGSIRIGELRPGQVGMKHALKVNVDSREMLVKCTTFSNCYRWPAYTADGHALSWYGTLNSHPVAGMKMGALLAIPGSVDLTKLNLETIPAKQMAWTLQNYGAYIVDSTGGAAFAFSAELGPDGSKRAEFQKDWGFSLEQRVVDNTPWSRDIQKLMQALQLVDNNSATSIGGGGSPRQPLAPAIAP